MLVSIYNNAKDTTGQSIELEKVVENIRTGGKTLVQKTEKCRQLQSDKDAYRKYKETALPAFIPSGTFKQGNRNDDGIDQPTGLVVIDIDGLPHPFTGLIKQSFSELPHTVMSFISPSGTGVKALISVEPAPKTADEFRVAWGIVKDCVENKIPTRVDGSGKNFSRLCFLAHDPDVYFNPDADSLKWEYKATSEYPPVGYQTPNDDQPSETEVEEWLEHANPDCSHDEWIGVGMTLYAGGFPCSMWESWSRGGTKYQDGECESRWDSFNGSNPGWGQIVNLAKQGGWAPPQKYSGSPSVGSNRHRGDLKTTPVLEDTESPLAALPVDDSMQPPVILGDRHDDAKDTLFVGGFKSLWDAYGDTHIWTPEMILAMGLSTASYLAKDVLVKTSEHTDPEKLNLYTLAIGASNVTGKSQAVKEMRKWIGQVDDKFKPMSNVQSLEGLLKGMDSDDISNLCLLDEVSVVFQNTRRPGTQNLLTGMGEIWTNSGSYVNTRAGGTEIVDDTYLCSWGNITTKRVLDVFRYEDVISGMLNRWCPFYIHPKNETLRSPHAVPEHYSNWVNTLNSIRSQDGRTLVFSDDADEIRWEWLEQLRRNDISSGEETGESRLGTQAVKIAGIIALVENSPSDNTITVEQWGRAFSIIQYLHESTEYLFKNIGATRLGKLEQEVLDVLNNYGNEMSLSDLGLKTRKFDRKERSDILDLLEKDGKVIRFKEHTGGRSITKVRVIS